MIDGQKVLSEVREALELRGGWSLGRAAVALPSMGVWSLRRVEAISPGKKFRK